MEAPDRVRILIWERGVGPTEASGTGACAAAVAAMRTAAPRETSRSCRPGGAQRVEWTDDGLFLTGWAELVAEAAWLAGDPLDRAPRNVQNGTARICRAVQRFRNCVDSDTGRVVLLRRRGQRVRAVRRGVRSRRHRLDDRICSANLLRPAP